MTVTMAWVLLALASMELAYLRAKRQDWPVVIKGVLCTFIATAMAAANHLADRLG